MAEHSPTPWHRFNHPVGSIIVRDAEGADVCVMLGMNPDLHAPPHRVTEVAGPDAEFIVRAVNAHNDLVAACDAALKRCRDAKARFVGRFVGDDELMEQLEHALAKAGVTDATTS